MCVCVCMCVVGYVPATYVFGLAQSLRRMYECILYVRDYVHVHICNATYFIFYFLLYISYVLVFVEIIMIYSLSLSLL